MYYAIIKNFLDKESKNFYVTGKSRKIPSTIHKVTLQKLDYLNSTFELEDLKVPPANRLEKIIGDLKEFYSIRINKQYRIIFKFENNNVYDIQITDYH
ncbi:MAG: Plasmid maintenance system killer protein [uncultured Sulfurovum sp.]|uniref:Plasmid maintenance system killer protein n=1 Tax=uncultured Sulfurovum sp. TaxID=269237 RepID=A0A6S6T2E6_9BACT|nr:MAG: Plasmid maintenance system killer protein [uncultured Sulfurovum sp.]